MRPLLGGAHHLSSGALRFNASLDRDSASGLVISRPPPPALTFTATVRLAIGNEFMGNTQTRFHARDRYIPFRTDLGGAWGETKVGLTGNITKNLSIYTHAGYQRTFNGKSQQWDGKIGLRISW
ncbi:autotransporter outer membrane beta-barrel domain-containing protein [Bordetella avium]